MVDYNANAYDPYTSNAQAVSGSPGMWGQGPLKSFSNAIVGGQNDWTAQAAYLDTSQSALEAAMAEEARNKSAQTAWYAPQAGAAIMYPGAAQAQQAVNTRGIDPALASQVQRQQQAQAAAGNRLLESQIWQQSREGMIAALAAQRQQQQASREQSIQEAKANQEAKNLENELNTGIKSGNDQRASTGFGSLLKGAAGSAAMGSLMG